MLVWGSAVNGEVAHCPIAQPQEESCIRLMEEDASLVQGVSWTAAPESDSYVVSVVSRTGCLYNYSVRAPSALAGASASPRDDSPGLVGAAWLKLVEPFSLLAMVAVAVVAVFVVLFAFATQNGVPVSDVVRAVVAVLLP